MKQVEAANEVLRKKKTEHDAAQRRWSGADTACHEFRRAQAHAQAQAVEDRLTRGIAAMDFATAATRAQWLRLRALELHGQLEAAGAELKKAQAAATAAQGQYRRELARREALNKLAAEAQRARTRKAWRVEEHETDDRLAHAMPR